MDRDAGKRARKTEYSCHLAFHLIECTAAGELHPPGATPSTFTQTKLEGFVLATDNGGQTWNSVELPQFNGTPSRP